MTSKIMKNIQSLQRMLIEAINERLPIEFEFGKSNNDPNWYKVKPKLFV